MAQNTDFTHLTYQEMLDDFQTRLSSDSRLKNLPAASIYQMFMEMLSGTVDMTNFYMQRVAEEGFIDTAKLDSSVIKHAKNLGYNPKRAIPASCEVAIKIKGPLPSSLKAGATVYFTQEDASLSFNNNKFILSSDYSYTFDADDIANGQSSTWSKTLTMAKNATSMRYWVLGGVKMYNSADSYPIKAFQGELAIEEIRGSENINKLGKNYQFYDIDDLCWSDWYGRRDPNAFNYGTFNKSDSLTKIGIGKNEEEAFSNDNLFEIEDYSIYLNEDVIKYKNTTTSEPLKVCCVSTNQDKTIRVQFGDGVIVQNGLISPDQNIYIQYLKTNGSEVNTVGTEGSLFTTSSNFYATQANGIIDITKNIQILINSDIVGGADFESTQSIKNNAPRYFASNARLITAQDFENYFKSLTSPINVKHALAWGQEDIESLDSDGYTTYKYLQNIVCYALAANPYIINGKINTVRDILNENANDESPFTLYGNGDSYIEHLPDYLKLLISYNSFLSHQYESNPSKQWLKNIKTIRENITPKMMIGYKVFSMPPFVQYFDVCGSVEVDSFSKLSSYKTEVENKIYEWLSENVSYKTPIYKADILKFFTERSETKSVNLDIKVSELVKTQENTLVYNVSGKSLTQIYSLNKNIPGASQTNMNPNGDAYYWNTLTIPKTDSIGNTISVNSLLNKTIKTKLYAYHSPSKRYNYVNEIQFTPYDVTESGTNLIISIYGSLERSIYDQIETQSKLYIYVSTDDDFVSSSNFSESNAANYGLSSAQVNGIASDLKSWINNATVTKTADRAIPLPYYIETMDIKTREETITRIGNLQNNLETELTEKSFWQYIAPMIISKYYLKSYSSMNDEDVDGEVWTNISNLLLDIYKSLKAVFCDSMLDDNNNIVNFSLPNELPIVRLNITYKYRS